MTPTPGRPGLKRALDVTVALAALALLALPLALVAVAVRLDSPGPALFRQKRVGLGGRPFAIHKFRTMTVATAPAAEAAFAPGDRRRVTRLGALLRRTKIDELPQLIDVVLGDMSLVGPRPEVPEWFACHRPADRAVMQSLRPGLTDFATLRFADEEALLAAAADPADYYRRVLLPKKARYARFYARRAGIATDLAILAATLARVVGLRRERRR